MVGTAVEFSVPAAAQNTVLALSSLHAVQAFVALAALLVAGVQADAARLVAAKTVENKQVAQGEDLQIKYQIFNVGKACVGVAVVGLFRRSERIRA